MKTKSVVKTLLLGLLFCCGTTFAQEQKELFNPMKK